MPFTFSHPAIILPLTILPRRWFSLTGLVIGSVSPDFEYFIRMGVHSKYGHTLPGILWFDLPLSIVLAYMYHVFVRDSLIKNLPLFLKQRLTRFADFHWLTYFKTHWLVFLISVSIGASSHIFWDGFTHEHGYFVELIPGLQNQILLLQMEIPVFKFLQHLSTLIGGLVIVSILLNLSRDPNVADTVSIPYWIIVSAISISIVGIRFAFGLSISQLGNTIVTIISAVLLSLIITPWLERKLRLGE